jgi:hypothetical protein
LLHPHLLGDDIPTVTPAGMAVNASRVVAIFASSGTRRGDVEWREPAHAATLVTLTHFLLSRHGRMNTHTYAALQSCALPRQLLVESNRAGCEIHDSARRILPVAKKNQGRGVVIVNVLDQAG